MNSLSDLAIRRIEKLSRESGYLLRRICNEENLTAKIASSDTSLNNLSNMLSEIQDLAEALRQST